jgi:hypothetical protein
MGHMTALQLNQQNIYLSEAVFVIQTDIRSAKIDLLKFNAE